jgi:iron complex transport system ATP-binding protein
MLLADASATAAAAGADRPSPKTGSLQLKGVSLERQGRAVLSDVSLEVRPAQVMALLGPNGSGKSSILRALAGVWKPGQGACLLDGADITSLPRAKLARQVSLVPQDTRIEFAFTVEQVVATGRYPHRGRFEGPGAADRQAIEDALRLCDVVHLRHRLANTLSGGERQRTLIARSLATTAPYLLLDEPTASLDLRHAFDVMALCSSLARHGRAVVLATHDLGAAARFADTVALVSAGQLVACGPHTQALTPATITAVFGVRAQLLHDESGTPTYLFHPVPFHHQGAKHDHRAP